MYKLINSISTLINLFAKMLNELKSMFTIVYLYYHLLFIAYCTLNNVFLHFTVDSYLDHASWYKCGNREEFVSSFMPDVAVTTGAWLIRYIFCLQCLQFQFQIFIDVR